MCGVRLHSSGIAALSVCLATDLNIIGWSKWSAGSLRLSLIGRAMLTFVHRHSMETHKTTFIQYQTLPTVGVGTVYPACEGYSRSYNETVLAWSIYLFLLLERRGKSCSEGSGHFPYRRLLVVVRSRSVCLPGGIYLVYMGNEVNYKCLLSPPQTFISCSWK